MYEKWYIFKSHPSPPEWYCPAFFLLWFEIFLIYILEYLFLLLSSFSPIYILLVAKVDSIRVFVVLSQTRISVPFLTFEYAAICWPNMELFYFVFGLSHFYNASKSLMNNLNSSVAAVNLYWLITSM